MFIHLTVDELSLQMGSVPQDKELLCLLALDIFPFITVERNTSGHGIARPDPMKGKQVAGTTVLLQESSEANSDELSLTIVGTADSRAQGGLSREFVTPTDALERVRLFLVQRQWFEIRPGTTVDEGFYYSYRFKKLVPTYQVAWTIVVTAHNHTNLEDVYNQLHSLSKRLTFLCRAADKISINALKPATNNSEDAGLYHLAYFCMLATGGFDDLAWIASQIYSFNLSRFEVALTIPPHKQATSFTKALGQHNAKLHSFITDTKTQDMLRVFYCLRDRLQHRAFLTGLLYSARSRGMARILYELPDDAAHAIRAVSADGGGQDWGAVEADSLMQIDPHRFALKALSVLGNLYDTMLAHIDWEQYIAALPQTERDALIIRISKYKQSLWAFLKWPSEPLYF